MENSGTMAYVKTGNDALTEVSANGVCNLRRDVSDVKETVGNTGHRLEKSIGDGFCETLKSIGDKACETLKAIGDSECAVIKNSLDIAHRDTIHLNGVERNLHTSNLEGRAILLKDIGEKAERTNDRIDAFERMAAEKFCKVEMEGFKNTQAILDRLTTNKLDEKNEIIDSLRHERYADRHAHQFALQNQTIDYLKQMLYSVEQTQRATSIIKQNGVGNAAIPIMPTTQQ